MNDVKDEYVSEAGERSPVKMPAVWVRWGAVAACAAIAIFAGTRLGGPAEITPTPPPVESAKPANLPLLTVEGFSGGMGFEGLLAYSVDELADSRPWKGETLETLPVYKNQAPTNPSGFVEGDRDALEAQVREMAARLGITGELTITDYVSPPEELAEGATPQGPSYVTGTAEGVEIQANAQQAVKVEFDPAVALPDGLSMDESDREALEAAGEYLKTAYADLLDMAEPVVALQDGDYTLRGEGPHYSLHIYDGAGSLTEKIVGYELKSAHLYEDEKKLWFIWLDTYDLSEKVGDYPIISAEEATDLLCEGNYITTVPAEMPGREKIVRTELMYRTDWTAEYFMPYYRFLVELDDPDAVSKRAAALGLKTYGAYYVPAVAGEYLTEMPVWDGRFN